MSPSRWIRIDSWQSWRAGSSPARARLRRCRADAAPQDLLDQLPGIDIEAALKRLMGNRKLFVKLLCNFGQELWRDRRANP